MYARTSTIQADLGKIDAGITYVRDQVVPTVTKTDGCIGMSMLADRESGRCIATTAWQSESALQNSADQVRPLRDQAAETLGGTTTEVDMWEIAVVHREHTTPDGAFARVTWLSGDTDVMDRAIDVFRMAVLPKVEQFDGFCSASFLVSRDSGRAVSTVTFASREQLEASREAASGVRAAASADAGAKIDDVAEMEVAFAHLHVPEMA